MKCNATLRISADQPGREYFATCTCGLEPGHLGPHEERYPRGDRKTAVIVQWEGDDSTAPGKKR